MFHPGPIGRSLVVGLELKAGRGRTSTDQIEAHTQLERAGAPVHARVMAGGGIQLGGSHRDAA